MNKGIKQDFEAANFSDGYRLTELGPLPEEWQVVRLGEILEETVERVNDSDHPNAADLPVLSLTKNEGLVLQSDRFGKRIATEDVSEYKVIRKGQIAYNPYVIWEGAIHILAKYDAGIVSPVYPVFQAKLHEADPYFLDAWLRTPPAIAAYNRFAAGAVNRRRAIRKSDFLQISIPLSPPPRAAGNSPHPANGGPQARGRGGTQAGLGRAVQDLASCVDEWAHSRPSYRRESGVAILLWMLINCQNRRIDLCPMTQAATIADPSA